MHSKDLFSATIASHALVGLNSIGILQHLKLKGGANIDTLHLTFPLINKPAVQAALISLTFVNLIELNNGKFSLTKDGIKVLDSMGEFNLWLKAYANLYPKIEDILLGKAKVDYTDVNAHCVAISSAEIGINKVDNYLFEILDSLDCIGSICDLGCGSGKRIHSICERKKTNGLGIDISEDAILFANENYRVVENEVKLKFYKEDVTRLKGSYPEVGILLQTFMTHHIIPEKHCSDVFISYKTNFPNAKYFIILDTVWPEKISNNPELFTSGFLLMHGLQGLVPRVKKDMYKIFELSNFELLQEVKLDVPNSYLWLLKI